MDNSEEDLLCRFGTPLEPLEEDDVPSKKPVAIEDQIVTDENGRRRFHGAFTGGFSAGFWNTVGSLEGWKPQSFKSSRTEKAGKRERQLPTDFMDDEDLGEFGIAPQRVQAREDFAKTADTSSRKRKLEYKDNGPIPGMPVLQQLLEPSREKVAIRLLRRMGWKPGQGIGARQTRTEKARTNKINKREMYVMNKYGCDLKSNENLSTRSLEETSDLSGESSEDEEVTFAPNDFEPYTCNIKDNTFGLGYSGLTQQVGGESSSHINLFSQLDVVGKDNKVLSIRGQAFGVGALEEEDEDIYAKDDMSKYDFSLESKKKHGKQKQISQQVQSVLDGFDEAKNNSNVKATLHRLDLKSNFQPRNWLQRKTRFAPLPEETAAIIQQADVYKKRGLGRHDMDPEERGSILQARDSQSAETKKGSETISKNQSYLQQISEKYKEREAKTKQMLDLLSSKENNFVKGGLITNSGVEIQSVEDELSEAVKKENSKIQTEARDITKSLGNSSGTFRPFANNEAKQERYEKFINANLTQEEEMKTFLATIQPVHLSEWDREMERKEFVQARNIYKPLNGMMSERFVSKSSAIVSVLSPKSEKVEKVKIVVKRAKQVWKPCSIICKRFNIAEPFGGALIEPKAPKKGKFSVFDYIENSINSKKDFVTPVIIPKHIEKPRPIQRQDKNTEVAKEKAAVIDLLEECVGPSTSKSVTEVNPIPAGKTIIKDTKKVKTEIELRVEESLNKHPSEKKDLFKCIFDSSDDETQDTDDQADKSIPPNTVPAEIVKTLVKPTVPINILRHNSPPRGIFAALFSNSEQKPETREPIKNESFNLDKISFKPRHERNVEQNIPELDNMYGPKLPIKPASKDTQTVREEDIDKKLMELLSKKPLSDATIVESWVEKSKSSHKKNKKEKKKKKTKDRKEKTKTKHKKVKKHKNKEK